MWVILDLNSCSGSVQVVNLGAGKKPTFKFFFLFSIFYVPGIMPGFIGVKLPQTYLML